MSVRAAQYAAVSAVLATVLIAGCRASSSTFISPPAELRSVCWHNDFSEWECPDSTATFAFRAGEVTSMSLTVTTRDGRTRTMPLRPDVDAMFLSKAAVQNFLVRYYDATDRTKAAAVRARIERRWP
jgi:hypothetical protein